MKTHWRKNFDYRFLAADELQGEVTLTIKEMKKEEAFNGKEKEVVPVLHFEKTQKGLVLNKTNAELITKVLKSPFIEDWIGKQITLYSTKIKAFGELVDAIRVKTVTGNLNALKQ